MKLQPPSKNTSCPSTLKKIRQWKGLVLCSPTTRCGGRSTERWGGGRGYFPGAPKLLRGPIKLLFSWFFAFIDCIFTLFLYLSLSRHCLDSMSEHFDVCKHVPLINWPCYINNIVENFLHVSHAWKIFPGPPVLSQRPCVAVCETQYLVFKDCLCFLSRCYL